MKNVIIRNLYAVGMHHHGPKEMATGSAVYYAKPELGNLFDKHAIAIYENKECTKIAAYLRRQDAQHVKELFDLGFIHGVCYVRAKDIPVKFNKFKGPMQSVSIGFKMQENQASDLIELMKRQPSAVYKVF